MDQLNLQQREAVEAPDGPVCIVAGPGTGKTKTLVARIKYLIGSDRAQPGQILALTFTKKAAEEMQARVGTANGKQAPTITTFHGLCYDILQVDTPFASDAQRLQIIASLHRPAAYKQLSKRELGLVISRAKNQPEISDLAVAKLVANYNHALAEAGMRDFDDLLLSAYHLLRDNKTLRAQLQGRYPHLLVDEFQDTNHLQYELIRLLSSAGNVFVIGDPNQSIYGFRGASGSVFEQFRSDFSGCKTITLQANYRSAPEIVAVGNAIFADVPPLQAQSSGIGKAEAVEVLNEYSEAEWVLAQIGQAIGGSDLLHTAGHEHRATHRPLRDFAVLYRSRAAAVALHKLVYNSGLPYQIVGDGSPYDQPEPQAIIALLQAAASGETPQLAGFSTTQLKHIQTVLRDAARPRDLAQKIVELLGFTITPSLQQFLGTLAQFDTAAQATAYFDHIQQTGYYDSSADVITLLTIHASKGLEFPCVFVVGCQEGILPHDRADESEEKRLFYVAATRAKERLVLTYARKRGGQPAKPSHFISDVPQEVLPRLIDPQMGAQVRRLAKKTAKRSQQSLF